MNLHTLTATDLMTREIKTALPDETVRDAAERMIESGIHCLLVAAPAANRGIGIIALKDVIQLISESGPEILEEVCVEEAMTSPALTVPGHLCISDCLRLMCMGGIRSAPVMDGAQPVGILSFNDILRSVLQPR